VAAAAVPQLTSRKHLGAKNTDETPSRSAFDDCKRLISVNEEAGPLASTPRKRRTFTRALRPRLTARIVSLRKEGMGAGEIAKAVGCTRGNVYNVYKALNAAGLAGSVHLKLGSVV
jgi:DNA invertase Pin-like site-specific DNA recombinase